MTKLEGRLLVSILVLLGTVLASSCDPVDPGAAAVQNSAGEIIIAAKTCKDSKVTSVRLIGTGASSDTLWEIDAPDGSSIESYVLGVTAPGFEQRTPLQEQPAPGTRYVIAVGVSHSRGPITIEFNPAELSDDSWFTNLNKRLSPEAFDRLSGCP